jgi:hypothetical protein
MRLGEMLVRDGQVTEEQLAQAVAQQQRDGGRFGTVLVELGLIDLDTLTVYLGIELGVPIATGATLERAKRHAVRLLSAEQAARYRCVPIQTADRQLIAAIDDPHDLEALVELAAATGYRVVPRVAPEIRIYYYLERYYGVARPSRFLEFGDSPRGARRQTSSPHLPAPPLPGLPPQMVPVPAPTPTPTLEPRAERREPPPPAAAPPVPEEQEALELDAADLLVELEADDSETAEQAPETHEVSAAPVAPPSDETYAPLEVDDAAARLREVTHRGEVAEAIMGYAAGLFEVAVLFIVRDNMAFGWKGFGPGVDRDRIETLLLPLEAPSILQTAAAGDGFFHARPFPATLHNHLWKVLRTTAPDHAAVAVIKIGSRVVNVLYGHRAGGRELSELDIDGLREIGGAASQAYVRLIKMAKTGVTADPDDEDDGADQDGAPGSDEAAAAKASTGQKKRKGKRKQRG